MKMQPRTTRPWKHRTDGVGVGWRNRALPIAQLKAAMILYGCTKVERRCSRMHNNRRWVGSEAGAQSRFGRHGARVRGGQARLCLHLQPRQLQGAPRLRNARRRNRRAQMVHRFVSDGWRVTRRHACVGACTSRLQRREPHAKGLPNGSTGHSGGPLDNKTRPLLCGQNPMRHRADRRDGACGRRGSGILQAGSRGERAQRFGGAVRRHGALAPHGGRVDEGPWTLTSASVGSVSLRRNGVRSGVGVVECYGTPKEHHEDVCRVRGSDAAHLGDPRG